MNWVTDSNDALNLSLVRCPEDNELLAPEESTLTDVFHPVFTYPIFGEEQKIFGYEDLKIELKFASGSLAQYLHVSSTSQIQSKSTPPDDIERTLYNFIPADYLKDEEAFKTKVKADADSFRPYGEKIHEYTRPSPKNKGKTRSDTAFNGSSEEGDIIFEVWKSDWNTPGFKDYHRKMQIFILLYIEGGSYVVEDEDQWEFLILYEKRSRPAVGDEAPVDIYHFAGYTSLYPFYHFPDRTRLRLSQFVILPPYQASGHGSELYSTLYQHVMSLPQVAELTVEDPSEAFEDLRDRCDLKMLLKSNWAKSLEDGKGKAKAKSGDDKLEAPVDREWAESERKRLKLAKRQFYRLLEMMMLLNLEGKDKAALRNFRLHVKERLFRFNYEILHQMEKEERIEKLTETYEGVEEDYRRILHKLVQ